MAAVGVQKFEHSKDILRAYCEVGIEYFKKVGDLSVFDAAMDELRRAEERIGDPDINRIMLMYERRLAGHDVRG
ncbi:MAG: hypothetical protein SFV21_07605 [Rhodospirillaceae bacterium]|nr:hypothetical protein [Rhodospirillaceae bacterium]